MVCRAQAPVGIGKRDQTGRSREDRLHGRCDKEVRLQREPHAIDTQMVGFGVVDSRTQRLHGKGVVGGSHTVPTVASSDRRFRARGEHAVPKLGVEHGVVVRPDAGWRSQTESACSCGETHERLAFALVTNEGSRSERQCRAIKDKQ